MLDSQSAAFAERVWEVASQLGNNAPKIADDRMEGASRARLTPDRGVAAALKPPMGGFLAKKKVRSGRRSGQSVPVRRS